MGEIKKRQLAAGNQGYTLIELVTVTGIMALFTLTLIGIFLATIRGGTKSQVVQQVHQNGDFALRSMSRLIRASDRVSGCGSSVSVDQVDGSNTVFSIVEVGDANRIASNSSQFLTSTTHQVSNLLFTCYDGDLGNQVVTIEFTITAGGETGAQTQEKFTQDFATSVSTRVY
jgi:type II secretory pathway pseudopilin PulG